MNNFARGAHVLIREEMFQYELPHHRAFYFPQVREVKKAD